MGKEVDNVRCPIVHKEIELGLCMDIHNVVDGMVIEEVISFTLSEEQKEMCRDARRG